MKDTWNVIGVIAATRGLSFPGAPRRIGSPAGKGGLPCACENADGRTRDPAIGSTGSARQRLLDRSGGRTLDRTTGAYVYTPMARRTTDEPPVTDRACSPSFTGADITELHLTLTRRSRPSKGRLRPGAPPAREHADSVSDCLQTLRRTWLEEQSIPEPPFAFE